MTTSKPNVRFNLGVLILTSASLMMACRSTGGSGNETQSSAPPAKAAIQDKMHAFSRTLSMLLPDLSTRARFDDPKNATRIENETLELKNLAHGLKHGLKSDPAGAGDPSMTAVSSLLEEDLARALGAMRSGNRESARAILRDTTSYCIECHTQNRNGADFPRLNLEVDVKSLSPFERAEFFAATRQFDRAIDAYREALTSEAGASDSFEWENAARTAVSIAVRVKNDPKETLKFVQSLEKSKRAPKTARPLLAQWKKSIGVWQKEKGQPSKSNADKLKLAEDFVARAKAAQEFPLDHSQDILYFRAASLAHDVLQNAGGADRSLYAHALYVAGVASEATRDMNFWTLHETYFEQCIRTLPHSPQAEKRYKNLFDSITLGYTGSSGTHVPPDIAKRLASFESLASTKSPTAH